MQKYKSIAILQLKRQTFKQYPDLTYSMIKKEIRKVNKKFGDQELIGIPKVGRYLGI